MWFSSRRRELCCRARTRAFRWRLVFRSAMDWLRDWGVVWEISKAWSRAVVARRMDWVLRVVICWSWAVWMERNWW